MNKNPNRPENMDEIMSQTFNKNFETEIEKYHKAQKKLTKEIFGD